MERVFKALGDPYRRILLDRLFERDGQTLAELDAAIPQMTRFGVMKHLKVLEAAHLITAHRFGRTKLHYINPLPIRLVLSSLKSLVETGAALTLPGSEHEPNDGKEQKRP